MIGTVDPTTKDLIEKCPNISDGTSCLKFDCYVPPLIYCHHVGSPLEMTRTKPRPGSATLRVFISVLEKVDSETLEITNEATQQEPDSSGLHTGSNVDMESAAMAPQEVQQASDEKGAQAAADNVDIGNTEAAVEAAQQSLDASGIGATDSANTASTLLENLKGISETLKSVLDIVVEKIDVLAKVGYRYHYASYYLN